MKRKIRKRKKWGMKKETKEKWRVGTACKQSQDAGWRKKICKACSQRPSWIVTTCNDRFSYKTIILTVILSLVFQLVKYIDLKEFDQTFSAYRKVSCVRLLPRIWRTWLCLYPLYTFSVFSDWSKFAEMREALTLPNNSVDWRCLCRWGWRGFCYHCHTGPGACSDRAVACRRQAYAGGLCGGRSHCTSQLLPRSVAKIRLSFGLIEEEIKHGRHPITSILFNWRLDLSSGHIKSGTHQIHHLYGRNVIYHVLSNGKKVCRALANERNSTKTRNFGTHCNNTNFRLGFIVSSQTFLGPSCQGMDRTKSDLTISNKDYYTKRTLTSPKTFWDETIKRGLKLVLLQCVLFFLFPNHLFKIEESFMILLRVTFFITCTCRWFLTLV